MARVASPDEAGFMTSPLVDVAGGAVYAWRDGEPWVSLEAHEDGIFRLPAGFAITPQHGYALRVVAPGYPELSTTQERS